MRILLSIPAVATLCFVSSASFAQTTTASPATSPASDAAAKGAATTASPTPVAEKLADPSRPDSIRFRFGFNVGGGFTAGSFGSGPNAGGSLRAGVQFNRWIGTYLQTGGTALIADGPSGTAAVAFIPISPMVSLTPIDQLEFAVGPSLDYQSGVAVSTTGGAGASSGEFDFGIAGRVAVHLNGRGDDDNGRRSGFTIGADIHPFFVGGTTIVPITFGIGGDWY